MSKKRKSYSAEFKTKVVLELLKEEEPAASIASRYGITVQTLNQWKRKFLENASLAFDIGEATKEYREKIEKLEKENEALAKTLGKTTIERDWAVGKHVAKRNPAAKRGQKSLDSSNKRGLVDSKLESLSLTRQCHLLGLNRSSLYYRPKGISKYDPNLMRRIDEIYTKRSTLGYRMIHAKLKEEGYRVWSGDITYIPVKGGFMYLTAIIDWHSRAILSWQLSNTMDTSLITGVLKEALEHYGIPEIFNSDQGSQYTSKEHTQLLKDNAITIAMNGKGRSIDNIAIERFFRTLKYEKVYIKEYENVKELKRGIKNFMDYNNNKRFHSSLGYKKLMDVYLQNLTKAA